MKRLLLLAAIVVLGAGCASTWSLDSASSDGSLQWPDAAGRPLLVHETTLKGFRQNGSSLGSIARRLIFGKGNETSFMQPVAVAVGRDGRIAVVDAGCACVHLFDPKAQRYVRILGPSSDRLRSPVGTVFDDDQRLYVTDSALGAVFVFNAEGQAIEVLRQADHTKLQRPTGLAYAGRQKILYVTDTTAHTIYALDRNHKLVFSLGGRGDEKGKFNFPTHLHSSDNGALYVTDSMNFRVQAFDGTGRFLSSFGRHGDGSGDFAMPKGLTVDRDGVIYVVDSLFDNVQLFSQKGEFLLTIGRRGSEPGEFWLPSGIFLDEQDKLYVCDAYNQRIQIFRIIRHGQE